MNKPSSARRARRLKRQRKSQILTRLGIMFLVMLLIGAVLLIIALKAPDSAAASMDALADDDPYLGPADAPVVIVEFSDYLCPYCGKFYWETLPQILETYPEQVKFVHRDFILMGNDSYQALMAAGCAYDQDKYWEMNDQLFSVYQDMDIDSIDHSKPPDRRGPHPFHDSFSEEKLVAYAQTVGLDMEAFNTCLAEEQTGAEVTSDHEAAQDLGIGSIPVYIVNGQTVMGYLPFEEFQPYIERALAEAHQ
ncbi:MAG: DsbA family protein [Anaerolineae bacterium]|nr:DsbA family protein [Anaerolineae bacterium]